MNPLLVAAGCLAVAAAAVHGIAGEILLVQRLSPAMLPSTRSGGGNTTKMMLRVSWHVATLAFLGAGCALILAGSLPRGDVARAIGIVGAVASTAFAALLVGTAGVYGPRALVRHPGPAMLVMIALLAWWGIAR